MIATSRRLAFFDGVPQSIVYDNTRLAVAKILGDGTRKRSTLFAALQSHYVFEDRYGRPARGTTRARLRGRIFMVPFPRVRDFADLNVMLETRCRERQGKTLRGHEAAIGIRLQADRAAFQDFPAVPSIKSLESFDFDAIPTLNKKLVVDLARSDFVDRRENVIALGPCGVGKSHVAIALGVAACQRRIRTRFATAAAIVHELIEAHDEKGLLRLQRQLASHDLLIIDELGFDPLSKTGAELLFELISQRYERGATIITSNLPFDEWTATFGEERLTARTSTA